MDGMTGQEQVLCKAGSTAGLAVLLSAGVEEKGRTRGGGKAEEGREEQALGGSREALEMLWCVGDLGSRTPEYHSSSLCSLGKALVQSQETQL